MCDFICGTMSHAKLSLYWSVVDYQKTIDGTLGVARKRLLVTIIYILIHKLLNMYTWEQMVGLWVCHQFKKFKPVCSATETS